MFAPLEPALVPLPSVAQSERRDYDRFPVPNLPMRDGTPLARLRPSKTPVERPILPNTRAYDGTHSLLGDLLDIASGKFRRYSTLPILRPDQHAAGARIANTMARDAAGVPRR
jgi:hypothetical protein